MAGEPEISLGVLQIANSDSIGIATFSECYAKIPSLVTLDAGNLDPSTTRPGEPMWHQIVRNIQSHHADEGNYIKDGYLDHVPGVGYEITKKGKNHLRHLGLA